MLLLERPEKLNSCTSARQGRYDRFMQSGHLITLRKWLSDTQIEEIRQYI